jgi:hypothetical protein
MEQNKKESEDSIINIFFKLKVNTKFLKFVSMDDAIILQHVESCIYKNELKNQMFIRGETWMSKASDSIRKDLRIFSIDKIKRAMNKFVKKGILKRDRFNENPLDRRYWHTFDQGYFALINKCKIIINQHYKEEITSV